jgi:hypothetical protein
LLLFLFVLGYTLDIAEVGVGAADTATDMEVGAIAEGMKEDVAEVFMMEMTFIQMILTIL